MSILSIAYSGLNAFQYALDVTANNIANQRTPGYSKQSILLTDALSERYGGVYVGTGVSITSIYRNADQFANTQMRAALSTRSQYETFYNQASQIDQLISQNGSSVSAAMQSFFDAFNQLNNAPDSAASRGVALSQSQLLVQQFNFLQSNLDQIQENTTAQITMIANRINQIGADLVAFNEEIMGNPTSPQLLDQRDQLLKELAEFSDLTVIVQDNGTVNVGIGSGEMLVVGPNQRTLSVQFDPLNTVGTRVLLGSGAGQLDISAELTTGTLGGLMSYESNIIAQTSQTVGLMAIGLAQKFNAQNKLGMDLYNQIGQDYFTNYNSSAAQLKRSISSTDNAGTGVLSVAISDLSQMKLSDYQLVVNDTGTNEVRVIRQSDGTSMTLNWSSNPPAPPAGQIEIDGMTITIDDMSKLVNNDSYSLIPTRGAARDLELLVSDPNLMALAAPVRTSAATSNTGVGSIALGTVFNTSGVSDQYAINFTSPTEFNVVDVTTGTTVAGPLPFTPNMDNVVQIPDATNPSYSVVLSGMPNAGDSFTAEYNQGGFGDNTNGLLLAGLQQAQLFDGGNESLFDCYSDLLSSVGSQTRQSKTRYEAFDVLYKQALYFQESKSGVNLDEEAANLLRLEQAYAAAGKLVEVSNQMMQVLFEMMR
ncbi:MAG: flagellar hook-associated protein FlgK [Legionella sp.]|uniref:flagellar hook-associated protein FlgK n=1 Tax=Legionella sp. TaxID=459 RepID=UPI00284291BE|nr:flagellar hook-associated protein FlgK [Legionella sp.]